MRFRVMIILFLILLSTCTGMIFTEDSDAEEYCTHNIILNNGLVFNESEGEISAEKINDGARFSVCYYDGGVLYFTTSCTISFELNTIQNAMTFNNTYSNGICIPKECSVYIHYNCKDPSTPAERYSVISAQCDRFTLSGANLYIYSGITVIDLADKIDAIYCKGDVDFNKSTVYIGIKSTSGKIYRYFGYAIRIDGTKLYIKDSKITTYSNIYNISIDGIGNSVMDWDRCWLDLHANNACFHFKFENSLTHNHITCYRYSTDFKGSGYIESTVGTNMTSSKYIGVWSDVEKTTSDKITLILGILVLTSYVFITFGGRIIGYLFEIRKIKLKKRRENAIRMQDVDEKIFRMIDDKTENKEEQSTTMITVTTSCHVTWRRASFKLEVDGKSYGYITKTESKIEITKGNHVVTIYDCRKTSVPLYHETVYFFGDERILVDQYFDVYEVYIKGDEDGQRF